VFEMGMIIKLYSHLNNYYTKDKIVNWMKKITLEKSLIAGGIILLLGIMADAVIVFDWAKNGFHDINLSRLAIFGLYFIFVGVSFISFSFLRAVMEKE